MKIEIDTDELVEFFGEGWCSCDISIKEELKSFLIDFCKQKIEGEEEKKEPVKDETSPIFGSITYYEREQAQRHLELLRDAIAVKGHVTVRDYYRLAEFLQILPKWTAMYFREEYGWRDLSTVRINMTHDKRAIAFWTLEMPVPERLKEN